MDEKTAVTEQQRPEAEAAQDLTAPDLTDTAIQDLAFGQAVIRIERLEAIVKLLARRAVSSFPTAVEDSCSRAQIEKLAEEIGK